VFEPVRKEVALGCMILARLFKLAEHIFRRAAYFSKSEGVAGGVKFKKRELP